MGRDGAQLMRWLAVAALLFASPSLAAPACTPPTSWPLGHHLGEFAQSNKPSSGDTMVTTSGWDPVYQPNLAANHQAMKDALITGITTYHVGLPGTTEPNDLPAWGGSCTWTNASLAAAGVPTMTLTADG